MTRLLLIIKRLAVWLTELFCITVFLILLHVVRFKQSAAISFTEYVPLALVAVAVFMLVFGFPFTTALFRVFVKNEFLWLYPVIATVLFAGHYIFAYASGGGRPDVPYGVLGAAAVFVCTLGGNLVLRRWTNAPKSSE